MTDLKRRSIVFRIDDQTWNRFKSRVGGDGRQIQELVLSWIGAYIDPPKPPAQKDDRPGGAVSRHKRPRREDLDPGSGRRQTLETAPPPAELLEYAERFDIPAEGKNEPALGGEVMDAIQSAYDEHGDDGDWIGENIGMLEFFNTNRGRYPVED